MEFLSKIPDNWVQGNIGVEDDSLHNLGSKTVGNDLLVRVYELKSRQSLPVHEFHNPKPYSRCWSIFLSTKLVINKLIKYL